MRVCPALSTGDAFLSSLLRHIDCQAESIGALGYQALAAPGSPLSAALTALLTIFIALFGLRMMMGSVPTLRDGVMAVVKIGVVLVIATSWPAYRTVVYDLVVDGPAQLATAVGRPAGLPGASGDLVARLQGVDTAIRRLTELGTGRGGSIAPSDPEAAPVPTTTGAAAGERAPLPDDPILGWSRVLFLTGAAAAFGVVRLTAGVLLALAPLFAGLLLFDLSRSLFAGWARALVFVLLGSTAVALLLGAQLALLEPWLANVLALREARVATLSAPVELLILCLVFTLAVFGSLAVLLRVAFTVHVSLRPLAEAVMSRAAAPEPALAAPAPWREAPTPPRAAAVAGAVAAMQRREQAASAQAAIRPAASGGRAVAAAVVADEFAIPSAGQAARRKRPRKSSGAALRDRRS